MSRVAGAAVALAACGLLYANLRPAAAPLSGRELASYATSLAGRSPGQRHNALKAAQKLDGQVIGPGATLSYNALVRSWASEPGWREAPVSYAGAMTIAVGGGVCQTSTTLYNAALLGGLEVLERHPHSAAPYYVPPGRDAAVAYPGLDLRLKNPYPWPVRVRARREGESLVVRLLAPQRPTRTSAVVTRLLSVEAPERRIADSQGRFRRTRAAAGCRVVSWRVTYEAGKEVRRERLADDTYIALDRVVAL